MSAEMVYPLNNPSFSTAVCRFCLAFQFSLKGTVLYWPYASLSPGLAHLLVATRTDLIEYCNIF